jgi:hypothetical protein
LAGRGEGRRAFDVAKTLEKKFIVSNLKRDKRRWGRRKERRIAKILGGREDLEGFGNPLQHANKTRRSSTQTVACILSFHFS